MSEHKAAAYERRLAERLLALAKGDEPARKVIDQVRKDVPESSAVDVKEALWHLVANGQLRYSWDGRLSAKPLGGNHRRPNEGRRGTLGPPTAG